MEPLISVLRSLYWYGWRLNWGWVATFKGIRGDPVGNVTVNVRDLDRDVAVTLAWQRSRKFNAAGWIIL